MLRLTSLLFLVALQVHAVPPSTVSGQVMPGVSGVIRADTGVFLGGSTTDNLAEGVTNKYFSASDLSTLGSKFGAVTYAVVGEARTANTNFLISSTLVADVCYTTKVTCSISLGGTCEGLFDVRSDTDATPTTSIGMQGPSAGGTLVIGLTLSNGQTGQICGRILPGHNVRIVTTTVSGSPSFSAISPREVTTQYGP